MASRVQQNWALQKQLEGDPRYAGFWRSSAAEKEFDFEGAKKQYYDDLNSDPKNLAAIESIDTALNNEDYYKSLAPAERKVIDRFGKKDSFESANNPDAVFLLNRYKEKAGKAAGVTNYNSRNDENTSFFSTKGKLFDWNAENKFEDIYKRKTDEDKEDDNDKEDDYDPTIVEVPDTTNDFWKDVVRDPDFKYNPQKSFTSPSSDGQAQFFMNKYMGDVTSGTNIQAQDKLNLTNAMYQTEQSRSDNNENDDDDKQKYFSM